MREVWEVSNAQIYHTYLSKCIDVYEFKVSLERAL